MAYDVAALKRDNPIAEIAGRFTKLTRDGPEYRGLCPLHKETTPSFTVVPGKAWAHCFGCGWHGDVIALVGDIHHVSFAEACAILGGDKTAPAALPPAPAAEEPPDAYDSLRPVPATLADLPLAGASLRAWNPKKGRWTTLQPSAVYPYLDAAGQPIGCVLRVELRDGKKWTPQMRRVALPVSDEITWAMMPFDRPRPLYGLDRLAKWPGEVVWCEGEKSADACAKLLPLCAIASPGGGNGIGHVDWSPLKGHALVIWGDCDAPGERTVLGYSDRQGLRHPGVAELALRAGATNIRYIPWDHDRPDGWDAADALAEGMTAANVHAMLRRARAFTGKEAIVHDAAPREGTGSDKARGRRAARDGGDGPPDARDRAAAPAKEPPQPFRILGHDGKTFYYLPQGTQRVLNWFPNEHSKANLLQLAPLDHWSRHFPHKSQDFHIASAHNALFRAAESAGFFEIDALRGRGAWIDEGRPLVHYGPHVTIAGEKFSPIAVPSQYIYEGARALAIADATPASDSDAGKLIAISTRLTWEHPLSAVLFVGWCIVATVCGALAWRPHIWVTGPPVSGKSTIIEKILQPLLGALAIYRQGGTTEAHLRQSLFHDARPIILDEAESEDKRAAQVMQNVLQLSRIASSGGSIGKGSADGKAVEYTVRTCFCFASINVGIAHYADETRIMKLLLRTPDRDDPATKERYAELIAMIATTISDTYGASMFARSVANLPTLLTNARTFAMAAAATLKDPRASEQIGTLLAGYHLCRSTEAISYDAAVRLITANNWDEHTVMDSGTDTRALIAKIALTKIRIVIENRASDFSIGDLVVACSRGEACGHLPMHLAQHELGQYGIRADDASYFIIANKCPALSRILEGTPWVNDWRGALRTIPGAHRTEGVKYFAHGLRERGMHIPIDVLKESD